MSECKRKYEVDIEEKNKILEEEEKFIDDLMRQMKDKKKIFSCHAISNVKDNLQHPSKSISINS